MADLIYYERNLPHRLPHGEALFITFRLAGSLPREVLERLQAEARLPAEPSRHYDEQKRYFGKFDKLLDGTTYGPTWLSQPAIAKLLVQSLHHFNHTCYELLCYCVMPNHVHLLLTLPPEAPLLIRTLQRLKSYTALQANKILGREGTFWQAESYDHVVRKGELERIIGYILENPVKAGFVDDWQMWPYTYLAPLQP